MKINVAQLLKGPVGGIRSYEVDEAVDVTDNGRKSMVRGEVSLMRTGRAILAQCVLHTEIEVECGRCLEPFSCPLTLTIEEEYSPTIDILTGAPLPLPEDQPTCFTIDAHNELDLAEAIRQYAIMAIPMKPLCHDSCAGLCPTCGHNLNEGRCDCPSESIDPRWRQLLEKVKQQKGIK